MEVGRGSLVVLEILQFGDALFAHALELGDRHIAHHEHGRLPLDRAIRNQAQTNQMAVEVRMQGLDYKAEVNRHCGRVLSSIQSRMGFIPGR